MKFTLSLSYLRRREPHSGAAIQSSGFTPMGHESFGILLRLRRRWFLATRGYAKVSMGGVPTGQRIVVRKDFEILFPPVGFILRGLPRLLNDNHVGYPVRLRQGR